MQDGKSRVSSDLQRPDCGNAGAMRPPAIWFEIEDLVRFFDAASHPTGIQRVCIELLRAALARPDGNIGFCRLSLFTGRFEALDRRSVQKLLASGIGRSRGATVRRGWAEKTRRRLQRAWGALRRDLLGGARREREFKSRIRSGDVLVCLAVPAADLRYGARIARAKRKCGFRFALLVHDIMPAVRPEFFTSFDRWRFNRWLRTTFPQCDLVFTSSRYVRNEIAAYAAAQGWLVPPIEIVRFGAGFAGHETGEEAGVVALPDRFVLYVSTIEARKNHRLLVTVWRRLIERHGSEAIPALVLAGGIGWLVGDLIRDLRASNRLDGKAVIVQGLGDAALAEAYRRSLFTVYPSLCEGWGLPVAESLVHGRFCISSNATSLPEVGGDFVDYFDPGDEEQAFATIERAIFSPDYLAERTAKIADDYVAPTWDACLAQLLGAMGRIA